jgi:hypothetical protein
MRELERLIEAMQRHWLLRKYVNQTNPPPLRPLSETAVPEKKPGKSLHSPNVSPNWGSSHISLRRSAPKCMVGLHPIAKSQPATYYIFRVKTKNRTTRKIKT